MPNNDHTFSTDTFTPYSLEDLDTLFFDEEISIHTTLKPSEAHQSAQKGSNTEEYEKLFSSLENREKFSLTDILGEGGMGVVYLAQQNIPEREVAVKKVKRQQLAPLLFEEAMILGRLSHPNILPLHQIRLDEKGQLEIVLKKIEGVTFEEILENKPQKGPELRKALQVLLQICHAVEFLHSQGYLHRDLKPENIMVGRFNQVYLMDLGLAVDLNKLNKSKHGLAGTPVYMAPEMLKGNPRLLSPATDVFLLGATLHEILTGERRNPGQNLKEVFLIAQRCPPHTYNEDIPKSLALLCNYACQKEPENRPQTIAEFREALSDFLEYWNLKKIIQKGDESFQKYKELWKLHRQGVEIDSSLLERYALSAKNSFEQSLKFMPTFNESHHKLSLLSRLMIEQALFEKDITKAHLLIENTEETIENTDHLLERVDGAQKKWEKEQKQIKDWEHLKWELTSNPTQKPRRILQNFMLIIIISLLSCLTIWEITGIFQLTAKNLFYIMLVLCFFLSLPILLLFGPLTINTFGRRSVYTIILGVLALTLSRFVLWRFDFEVYQIIFMDCFLLSLIVNSAESITKHNTILGVIGLCLSLFALFLGENNIFVLPIFTILVGITISYEWKEARDFPQEFGH